jgi:hypothetical protein
MIFAIALNAPQPGERSVRLWPALRPPSVRIISLSTALASMRDAVVDIEVEVLFETDKAWRVRDKDTLNEVWIPKSQGEIEDGLLTIPEWLAIEKELI